METDIIKIKKKCSKCGGSMKIERCSENGFRWKNIFCENFCWQITTKKKPVKRSNEYAHYIHRNGKSYLDNGDGNFQEAEIRSVKKGIKVVRFGPIINFEGI